MIVIDIQEMNFSMIGKVLILNTFSNMKCCALSNFVRLSHHYHYFKRERNFYNDPILPSMGCMPCGSANCIMAENITNENGELMYICTKCDKQ
jgi:alpha-D-ribose 1-methylphosphonate 5-phosphate C-P lyase